MLCFPQQRSLPRRKIETQCQFLRFALQLAKQLGKVIILHVRSHDKDKNAQAAKDTLKILLDLIWDTNSSPLFDSGIRGIYWMELQSP